MKTSTINIHPAQSLEERKASWRLVYHQYREHGYTDPHPSEMVYSVLDLLPGAAPFVATQDGVVVGSVTGILDSPTGLAARKLFSEELSAPWLQGHLLCETTKLACQAKHLCHSSIALDLVSYLIHWCDLVGVNFLLGVIHPKHVRCWNKVFGFRELGQERPTPYVKGSPGVLVYLNVREALDEVLLDNKRGSKILTRTYRAIERPREITSTYRLSTDEAFDLISLRPEVLQHCTTAELRAFAHYYPTISSELPLEREIPQIPAKIA
jgi:hypothetical protein